MPATKTLKKPRVSKEEYAKQQRETQRQMISDAVERLKTSEGWINYITTAAKFHKYSFNNRILIALQNPQATKVAGGKSWPKNFNRKVVPEGYDSPIIILAPCMVDQKDENGNPVMGENGKPKQRVAFYRSVKVYDVSQTEGEEIPELPLEPITGSSHLEYLYRCEQMATGMGFTYSYEEMDAKQGGYCDPEGKKIAVNIESAVNARVRTFIHELAHAHGIDYKDYTREQAEVIVESAAFMVCHTIGLDTSGMSIPYIASWDGDEKEQLKTLREFASTIDTLATKIEEAIS